MENKTNVTTTFLVKKISFINHIKNGSFAFNPDISILVNKISENEWETSFNVKVSDKDDSPFPFDLDVVVSLITKFSGELPNKKELSDYLKFDSTSILFPYVRSIVTNISTSALVAPIVLPLMNIGEYAKKISIPELD
jgi:preprotein translocase subunit SecB